MFYVYLYIDPRNQKPFYVGKGSGNRMYEHLNETIEITINKRKFFRIQSILRQGLEPIILKDRDLLLSQKRMNMKSP